MTLKHFTTPEKARFLIQHSNLCAAASIRSFEEQYPDFSKLSLRGFDDTWYKLFTISCIGVALTQLADSVPRGEQVDAFKTAQEAASEWNSESSELIPTFLDMLIRHSKQGEQGFDVAIGRWFWDRAHIFRPADRTLTQYKNSIEVQSATGILVISAVTGYWTT